MNSQERAFDADFAAKEKGGEKSEIHIFPLDLLDARNHDHEFQPCAKSYA